MHALDNVSLEVAEGEFIVVVGPSGCGKSTLLDIIAGLEKPDKGRVIADNQPSFGRDGIDWSCFRNRHCFRGSMFSAT